MLNLIATTDEIELVTDAVCDVDIHASFVDLESDDDVVPGKQNTNVTTATTTDIVDGHGGGAVVCRNVKTLHITNTHATTSVICTVQYDQNGTKFELYKTTLLAGESLEYVEGIGWYVIQTSRREFYNRRVTSDYVNATTSPSDVTGLTCPVTSGKHYLFETHLYHFANAATNGPRFGIGGVAMTAMRIQAIITETGSVAAGVVNTNIADVTAVDTAVQATTDSQATTPVMSIMSGWFQPSASGTLAVRAWAETAVAAALTIKTGSWLQVWESDN